MRTVEIIGATLAVGSASAAITLSLVAQGLATRLGDAHAEQASTVDALARSRMDLAQARAGLARMTAWRDQAARDADHWRSLASRRAAADQAAGAHRAMETTLVMPATDGVAQ